MHQLSAQLTLLHEEKSGLCAPYISPAGRVNCVLKNGPCFTIATSTTVCYHWFEIPPGSKTSNFPTPFVCNSIRVFLKVYSSSLRYMVFLRTVLWNFPVPIFLNGLGDCVLGLRNSRKTPFTAQVFLLVWNQKVSSLKCRERKDRYSKQRRALQARCYLVPKHTLTTQQITQYLLFNLPVGQKTHNRSSPNSLFSSSELPLCLLCVWSPLKCFHMGLISCLLLFSSRWSQEQRKYL